MSEVYSVVVDGSQVRFEPRTVEGYESIEALEKNGHAVVNVMGDPNLLFCSVYKKNEGTGGCFAVLDSESLLFIAVAESNLAYAMAQGVMGQMVSHTRYGADIFDELGEDDED